MGAQLDSTVRSGMVHDSGAQPGMTYLACSFQHLEHALERRLCAHFSPGMEVGPPDAGPESRRPPDDTPFGRFVREHARDEESRLLVLLALAPWMKPDFFDRILQKVVPAAGDHPEVGGLRGRQHRGFIPTGDTVLFLLAGDDLD